MFVLTKTDNNNWQLSSFTCTGYSYKIYSFMSYNKAKIKSCSISQIKLLTTLLNSCPVLQVKITKFKIILVQFYKFRIQLKVIIFWRSSYSSCSPYQRYLVRTQLVVFPSPDVKSCIFEWSPPCLVMKGRDIEFESQHFIWVDFHPHFLKKM